jgi:DNA-binding NarL/FixJ family response regulator
MNDKWVLLAEDDKLFAKLFRRYWEQSFPDIPLVQVSTTVQARIELGSRNSPAVVVLDYNLEDGTTEQLHSELSCPSVLWTSCSDGHLAAKPNGRDELSRAVRAVAEKGGVVPPQ